MSRYHIVVAEPSHRVVSMDIEAKTKEEVENKFKEQLGDNYMMYNLMNADIINLDNPPHWFPDEMVEQFSKRWENGRMSYWS